MSHAGDPPSDAIVSIRDLSFRHARADGPALRGVSLDIRAGELVGLVGRNGAGKTTLGLCLNGIVPHLLPGALTGSIRVAGHEPSRTPVREMAALVGVVLDHPEAGLCQPTAAEEVALGLENLGVAWADMVIRVAEALEVVGLGGFEERSPSALSGGEQQRLAIACAIAPRPAVLFLDEPAAHLDAAGRVAVFRIVRRLARDSGVAVLLADHDVEALAEHADRIVVLDEGAIAIDGPPAAVFGRVAEMARLGLPVPGVTAVAAGLTGTGEGHELPVTVEAAARWLAARG
jgi:energy-coupling factor transporter ATP-binding protein EcfA2